MGFAQHLHWGGGCRSQTANFKLSTCPHLSCGGVATNYATGGRGFCKVWKSTQISKSPQIPVVGLYIDSCSKSCSTHSQTPLCSLPNTTHSQTPHTPKHHSTPKHHILANTTPLAPKHHSIGVYMGLLKIHHLKFYFLRNTCKSQLIFLRAIGIS